MTTLETLKAARKKITKRKNWTRGEMARDKNSRAVEVLSPKACRWCAIGAVEFVALRNRVPLVRHSANARLANSAMCFSVFVYNDTHTHAEVLAMFDKAIANLEAA